MADPHPTPHPRFSRGRGNGVRFNSLTSVSPIPIPTTHSISKHAASVKDFFSARKHKKSPRHKVTFNLNSLRNFPYQSHTICSQTQNKSIMPSPVVTAAAADSPTAMVSPSPNEWTQVPKKKSAHTVLTQLTQDSIESAPDANSFAVFTDDDDDDVPTDSAPLDSDDDFLSPFEFPAPPPRPKRTKKSKKKSKSKKLRKSKSRGSKTSDTSIDSDAEVQLKRYSDDKTSHTQRAFFDEDSTPDSTSDNSNDTPDAALMESATSVDLVDSDTSEQAPKTPLKNADIRSYYKKSKPINHPKTLAVPIRICVLDHKTSDTALDSFSPRVILALLVQLKNDASPKTRVQLTKMSYSDLCSELDDFHNKTVKGTSSSFEVTTRSFGFFDRSTTE